MAKQKVYWTDEKNKQVKEIMKTTLLEVGFIRVIIFITVMAINSILKGLGASLRALNIIAMSDTS